MIDAIKDKAILIQDRLWDTATKYYGLERTEETSARIHNTFSKIMQNEYLKRVGTNAPFLQTDSQLDDVDSSLALAFMSLALVDRCKDQNEALEALVNAAEAAGSVSVHGMMRPLLAGLEQGLPAKKMASELAKLRHAENYALSASALAYWRENIDPNLSAAKAANELLRVVPLSHKKLSELVSAEKKKNK